MSLTSIQNDILQYIKQNLASRGVAPSTSEICEAFGFRSFGTVARHMKRLEEKGYLHRAGRRNKQGIRLTDQPHAVHIPLVGTVAAGLPIESFPNQEEVVTVPLALVRGGEHFALRVRGASMVEDGIFDGDLIIVLKQNRAVNGQTVVALLENEATVKRFYANGSEEVELRPANASMSSIWVRGKALKTFLIQGVVVGLFRQFA